MAFCSLPCWTYFSAALRTFCLLKPKPNAIKVRTPAFPRRRSAHESWERRRSGLNGPPRPLPGGIVGPTRAIVRLVTQNRMVTKGYQKGVYDRVTEGTWESGRIGKCSRQSPVASLRQKTQWLDAAGDHGEGCPVGDVSRPGNPVLAVRARRGRWPSE